MYKVIKAFKCRHQELKVFKEGQEYNSVNEEHTKKLLELGYIKEVKKKATNKKVTSNKKETKRAEKK